MNTFLSPIEKPEGLIMKLAYAMTRRQLGKAAKSAFRAAAAFIRPVLFEDQ